MGTVACACRSITRAGILNLATWTGELELSSSNWATSLGYGSVFGSLGEFLDVDVVAGRRRMMC